MSEIRYKPIGVIHSPFKEPKGASIQSATAKGSKRVLLRYLRSMLRG